MKPICTHCKYHELIDGEHICKATPEQVIDYVTGEEHTAHDMCWDRNMHGSCKIYERLESQ